MIITKVPLTICDIQLLKRAFKIRIFLGMLFALPTIILAMYFGRSAINQLIDHEFTASGLFGCFVVLLITFLLIKFVIPFYRNSYKNLSCKEKLIVETKIINIKTHMTSKGAKISIDTEFRLIDCWSVSMLKVELNYTQMHQGMNIKIHCLENNKTDILYITR